MADSVTEWSSEIDRVTEEPDETDYSDDPGDDAGWGTLPSSPQRRQANYLYADIPADDNSTISSVEEPDLDNLSVVSDDYIPNVDDLVSSDEDDIPSVEPPNTGDDYLQPGPLSRPHLPPPVAGQTQKRPQPTQRRQRRVRPRPEIDDRSRQPWVRVYPPEPEKEIRSKFIVPNAGPQNISNCIQPIDFLYLFMTTAMWNLMVTETNKFAQAVLRERREAGLIRPQSRITRWVDVTVDEMKRFWGVLINMGLADRKNHTCYWNTEERQYSSFYSKNMSLRRFELIMSMFHLSSEQGDESKPFHNISAFVEMMNDAFKKYFVPGQNICIDESMVGMKNRCVFIQYMPKKRHSRFGIKKFELCDSVTSYCLHVSLYSGRNYLSEGVGAFTFKVVVNLLNQVGLLDKGYHLFTDNFYTKIPLAEFLLSRNTFLTGTMNKNSLGLCRSLVDAKLCENDATLYYRRGDVLLVKYQERINKPPVLALSTGTHAENKRVVSARGIPRIKPHMINQYNKFMGGVDVHDKSLYHHSITRPCKKYWRKVVYNFVDIALLNAWILYKLTFLPNPHPTDRTKFMFKVVAGLTPYDSDRPLASVLDGITDPTAVTTPTPTTTTTPTPALTAPLALPSHRLANLPTYSKHCAVCAEGKAKKLRVKYWCPGCNAGVHQDCFPKLRHFHRPGKGWRPNK